MIKTFALSVCFAIFAVSLDACCQAVAGPAPEQRGFTNGAVPRELVFK